MLVNELQRIVLLEAACLALVCTIIVTAFFRWKIAVAIGQVLASIAFFTAWSFPMALGAFLVYVPASILLFVHIDNKNSVIAKTWNFQLLAWFFLVVGVVTIIVKNICNILGYLSH